MAQRPETTGAFDKKYKFLNYVSLTIIVILKINFKNISIATGMFIFHIMFLTAFVHKSILLLHDQHAYNYRQWLARELARAYNSR